MPTALKNTPDFETNGWVLDEPPSDSRPSLALIRSPEMGSSNLRIYPSIKRAFDIIASASLLVLFALPMLMIAIAIRLESKGPAFFTQTRCSTNGRHFRFWKFRSMVVNAEAQKAALADSADKTSAVRFKMTHDPRITTMGRFIRKYSIDELPQLWNVLVGDMSMVGPRPPLPDEVARYTPFEQKRLSVIPGITCTWQISGRSEIPFDQQVEMDIEYITERSLMMDLAILLKTPFAVIAARGAY